GAGGACGVVEGDAGQPLPSPGGTNPLTPRGMSGGGGSASDTLMIAELHGHPFGVDPSGVRYTGNRYPLAEVRLLAPVLPSKVVAVGKNYAGHVKEMGGTEPPSEPILFLKPSTAATGPGDPIANPGKRTNRADHR